MQSIGADTAMQGDAASVIEGKMTSGVLPRVWLLLGHKAGDNNQVLALAEELGWPCEHKRIVYRGWELLTNLLLRVTLLGIDRARSSSLEPPWPDLVITSGRRNEPVARWIAAQRAGIRIVHVGRPWAALQCFDLIISTPQYRLPPLANVLVNQLPLHRLDRASLARAALEWQPRLAHLPLPRIAVLLGGNSGAYVFSAAKARRLGQLVNGLARSCGGSVLATDSARTPALAMDAFLQELEVPFHCHRWGTKTHQSNPYQGYLALADRVVVTADSMSMIAEAAFTASPLYLFSLDDGPGWWRRGYNYRFKALIHRLAMAWGPQRMRRDVGIIVDKLIASGRAAWLGAAAPAADAMDVPDDAAHAARAIRALFQANHARRV
jgi:uncharacterized protein